MATRTLKVTPLAGVLGHPVAHSLSPEIFAYLAERLRRPLSYHKLDVAPEKLAAFVEVMAPTGLFCGWNVTIPHKERMTSLVGEMSREAAAIGAVNVVTARRGQLVGFNTDWIGVRATLEDEQIRMRGQTALLYGAGGAAFAVAYALGKAGAREVWVANRTASRAEFLCARFARLFPKTRYATTAAPGAPGANIRPRLLVNATAVGLSGVDGAFELPRELGSDALAFDLLYRPPVTAFLRAAWKRGLRGVNGLDMLVHQALATWEIWFGRIPAKPRLKRNLVTWLRKRL